MSGIDFGEIKVTFQHKEDGVWYGDATEIPGVTVDERADTATSVGVLLAGKAAIDIVLRGYSYANPQRDEPNLNLDHFVTERLVNGVLLRSQAVHVFRRDVSHGVGLFSPDNDVKPFGLVVPGMGSLVHRDRLDDFTMITEEAHLKGDLDIPLKDIIASKAIGLANEYARITDNEIVLV